MSDYYILIRGKPKKVECLEWAKWFETANRKIAHTGCSEWTVSTVFLGLDHSFFEGGPPMIFETLVFGGSKDGEMERYSTKEEALKGHERMVRYCRTGCKE